MRPRLLLATILATIALALSNAVAQEPGPSPDEEEPSGLLFSCGTAVPSLLTGCWLERTVLVLGSVELALAVDAQADVGALTAGNLDGSHLAVYGTLGVYEQDWSAWIEVWLPRFAGTPIIGSPDWIRVGFNYRIPP